MLPLTPGAPWQKQSTCVIGSGFEKPLKTINTTCKHKMVLKSLNCRGFSSGWNNFCFIKIILCIINMDHYRERQKQSSVQFSSVQLLNHIQLFVTPWIAAHQASLSITNSQSLLKLMSMESVMPSNHLILNSPLLFLPSIFPSIRVFFNESVLPIKVLEFQLQHQSF